jgi:hypothetical protein
MTDVTLENARNEIVFALRKEPFYAPKHSVQTEAREPVRRPVRVENRDLESAIDDMIEGFPTTLEYLAK